MQGVPKRLHFNHAQQRFLLELDVDSVYDYLVDAPQTKIYPGVLIDAVKVGNLDMCKLLLKRKDVDINYACQWSALEHGVDGCYLEICQLLLENEKIEVTDFNATFLRNTTDEIFDLLLLRYKSLANCRNHNNVSLLAGLCAAGNYPRFKLLLEYGVDRDIIDDCLQSLVDEMWWDEDLLKYSKLLCSYGGTCIDTENHLGNQRQYLPPWNRFTTAKRYPYEFNKIAFEWLQNPNLPKDLLYLILEYIAEKWKNN